MQRRGEGSPSAVAIGGYPSSRRGDGGPEGSRPPTVCAASTVVTVLNYPHLGTGSYERDDSNARARCNEERITDGFVPLSAECASVIFCINSSAENKESSPARCESDFRFQQAASRD